MNVRRTMTALAMGLAFAAVAPATAQAAAPASTGIIADYNGKKIDLSKTWGDAQACAEIKIGDVRCYDTEAEANRATNTAGGVSTKASGDCPSGYVCLWANSNFTGRRLQWSAHGTKTLGQYGFRDKASSVFARRPIGGVEGVDYRTGRPDPHVFLAAATYYDNLQEVDYVYGGTWNDRFDEISI